METSLNVCFYDEANGALTTVRDGRMTSVDCRQPLQPTAVNNTSGFAPLVPPVMNFGGDPLTTNPGKGQGDDFILVAPSMNWESSVNTLGQIGGAYDPEPQPQMATPVPDTPSYVGAAVPFAPLVSPMMNFRR